MNKTINVFAFSLMLVLATTSSASPVPLEQDLQPRNTSQETAKQEVQTPDPAYQVMANDETEARLQKERIRAALDEVTPKRKRFDAGSYVLLHESQERLLEAMLDFHKDPKKIISLLEQNVILHCQIEEPLKSRFENGVGRPDDYAQVSCFRVGAELALLRAKRKHGLLNQSDRPDDMETKLLEERITSATDVVTPKRRRVASGQDSIFALLDSEQRLLEALLDFHKQPDKIIELMEQQVSSYASVEKNRELRFVAGVGRPDVLAVAKYFRSDSELQLLRARKKYKIGDVNEATTTSGEVFDDEFLKKYDIEIDPIYLETADDGVETRLQKAKIRARLIDVGVKEKMASGGIVAFAFLHDAQRHLLLSLLDFHKEPKEIISILESHVEFAKNFEADRKSRFDNGVGRPDDYALASYIRADAELQLFRARKKFNKE
ncbi:MAG: hypothetical protein ACI87E_002010 [Mariniblastus sp.]|jgi:hypothetical protein